DFEAPGDADGDNVYEIEITADDGIISETKAISVTVTDVDEPLAITSDGGGNSALISVPENGTAVTTVTTDDPEETPTFTIIGDDASFFDIDAVTGELTFKAAPDFEAPGDADQNNVYEVTVEADDGQFGDSQALSVEVTDISDTPPEITSNGGGPIAGVSVAENGTAVTTMEADDPEETPTYAIIGGTDALLFDVDAATGAVTFIAAPDFDAPADADGDNVYEVEVEAGDGLFVDTQAITVEVTNVGGLTVKGTSADETLAGAGEEDTLSGKKGEDRLEGLGGNDLLNGGKHKDKLFGGDGADGFLFTSKLKNAFADRIKDFEVGVDTIHLDRDIFDEVGGAGRLKTKYFDLSKTADSRQDRILYEEDKGWLRYDADGEGGADAVKFAKIGKNLDLSRDDFMVV
ncbi:MAG: hypothetical protein GY798_24760, partial [Hyphomicrobiales bacterium]|nr:hypothetical protein [Hyphomicrobiales bacterium]